jgi:hypothetical protein
MRESSTFPHYSLLLWARLLLALLLISGAGAQAADRHDAERAGRAAAPALEKLGFVFRADSWVKELKSDVGKAVRMQLFRGLEYRFILSVPPSTDTTVTGVVLDFDGRVRSQQVGAQGPGKTVVIGIKPSRTGVYAVAVRQASGSAAVPCCILTGYK